VVAETGFAGKAAGTLDQRIEEGHPGIEVAQPGTAVEGHLEIGADLC